MHRCTSSNSSSSSNYSSFSMFFSGQYYPFSADVDSYPNTSSSSSSYSSSSVDCTLSLATPSTRQSENAPVKSKRWSGSSFMSNLCSWSALNSKKKVASSGPRTSSSSSNGGNGSVMINTVNGDPLLARRCANCDTTSTPLWRNGPRGPKSLCNACGIRYKKEERRATAAATAVAAAPAIIEAQQFMGNHHHQSWNYRAHERVVPSEFRFIEEGDDNNNIIEGPERTDHTATVPYFSWHLNVPERHGLVHDYS